MSDTPDAERSTDANKYDADAAATIARERLADDLEPASFGAADDLADALAAVAADLRADDVNVPRLYNACVHLETVQDALREASELYGYGWEENDDAHVTRQPAPDVEPAREN